MRYESQLWDKNTSVRHKAANVRYRIAVMWNKFTTASHQVIARNKLTIERYNLVIMVNKVEILTCVYKKRSHGYLF